MREYTVTVNGVRTTMQLSDEHARRLGATGGSSDTSEAGTVENKARTTAPGTSGTRKTRRTSSSDDTGDESDTAGAS